MSKIGGVEVHPDMKELLDAKAAVPETLKPGEMRTGWNNYAAALWRAYPKDMKVNDTALDCPGAGSAGRIPVRIYRPGQAPNPAPCVVFLHGGAFIKGSLDSGDTIAWGIADRTGCVVVSVDYRLAPENAYPAGVNDAYAVMTYLATRGKELGIDQDRLGVWGDSAGACIAAAVCLMARDRGGPKILAQALNYATFTDDLSAPAYKQFADAPVTTASIDRAWNLYIGDRRPTSDPYAAPLKAKDVSNLPPAHVHLAEIDCLADDSRTYAAMLKAAGNRAVLREAKGMIHGYLRSRFSGPAAEAEFEAPCIFLREILGGRLPTAKQVAAAAT